MKNHLKTSLMSVSLLIVAYFIISFVCYEFITLEYILKTPTRRILILIVLFMCVIVPIALKEE
jgi:hypothetical protein